jgi:chloramphenicol-sensitive protein RarD
LLLIVALLCWQGRLFEVRDVVRNRRNLKFMVGCSMTHMFGWGFYVWAVCSGHILDAALGHYILPMLSVLCGFLLFRERPRRLQWVAIATAAVGVLGMVVWYGSLPWVGLLVAFNSVLFASIRKHAPVNAMPGLCLELLISAPILWSYLTYLLVSGSSVFMTVNVEQDLWLIGAGIVTIIPQMGYAYGLCRVPLTTISLLQYLPPTGNVLVGILLFGEVFTQDKIFGFSFIWLGLLIFSLEAYHWHTSNNPRA